MTNFRQELTIFISEYKRFKLEAKECIAKLKLDNTTKRRLFNDWHKSFISMRVNFNEYYYQYELFKLSKFQRKQFISRSEMQKLYRKLVSSEVRDTFLNKSKFLYKFDPFIHRKWILCDKNTSIDELQKMLSNYDCILKPQNGSLGIGIKKFLKNTAKDYDELRNVELSNGEYLIEECVTACDEISDFHPESLNTIRVVTFSNNEKAIVFGAFIRFGNNNNCVDNAHSGGIFAQINVSTGVIESCGIDTNNNHYEKHPITQKEIKGFTIPKWDEIKMLCINATHVIPNVYFAGRDVALRKDGDIELVEANHGPDFDVMQSPLKIGVRNNVFDALKSLKIL